MLKSLKFYSGVALLIISFIVPFLGFWVATLPLPMAIKGVVIGALTVGGPEVLAILAVAMLGKEAFELLRSKALSWLKRIAPSGSVSRGRYKFGLVLFVLSVLPSYVISYEPSLVPDSSPYRLYVSLAGDILFVISLFVLGGDFWDKLRALFIYDARAQFPTSQSSEK